MTSDSDLKKAFQFFRRSWGHGGAYGRAPRPAFAALEMARKALAALPALEEAAKAAGAALKGPRDISKEEAAKALVESAYGAAMEAERAAQSAYDVGRDFGPLAEAMKARRLAGQMLQEAKALLARVKSESHWQEKAKAAHKALQAGQDWRYSGPVWKKGGKAWPQSEKGLFFFETEEQGLRNIEAAADLIKLDHTGFYADSYQENICAGYVAQLPSHNGKARFVAGYQFSESDSGLGSFDLGRIFESDFEAERDSARHQIGKAYWTPAMEAAGYWAEESHKTAKKEAARAADSMAERAADQEREYQEAARAGADWAEKKEEEAGIRREALAILKERKAARSINPAAFPALCAALRGNVAALVRELAQSRKERAALADSVSGKEGRAAFCDGAGLALEAFPN